MSNKYQPDIDQPQEIAAEMSDSPDNWPKHPDGTNMTIGEMPEEDRKRIMREASARYKAKGGEAHAKLADIIDRKWGDSDGL